MKSVPLMVRRSEIWRLVGLMFDFFSDTKPTLDTDSVDARRAFFEVGSASAVASAAVCFLRFLLALLEDRASGWARKYSSFLSLNN